LTTIVLHVSPDWDCLTAAWQLVRFYPEFNDAELIFVNTGNPDPAILADATAVVDTGKVYDRKTLRFDHHQLAGHEANTSAAELVYSFLISTGVASVQHLIPLINMVTAGDLGIAADGADWSRKIGIHALLSAHKAARWDDEQLTTWAFDVLDALNTQLLARHQAQQALVSSMTYQSDDGYFVVLENAPPFATSAAYEHGARMVMFVNYETNTIGIQRATEWSETHVGKLIEHAIQYIDKSEEDRAIADELTTWFLHPAGWFAGRGTAKAPREDAVTIDVIRLAQIIDFLWSR